MVKAALVTRVRTAISAVHAFCFYSPNEFMYMIFNLHMYRDLSNVTTILMIFYFCSILGHRTIDFHAGGVFEISDTDRLKEILQSPHKTYLRYDMIRYDTIRYD